MEASTATNVIAIMCVSAMYVLHTCICGDWFKICTPREEVQCMLFIACTIQCIYTVWILLLVSSAETILYKHAHICSSCRHVHVMRTLHMHRPFFIFKYTSAFLSEIPQVSKTSLQCKAITWPLPFPSTKSHFLAHSKRYDPSQDKKRV